MTHERCFNCLLENKQTSSSWCEGHTYHSMPKLCRGLQSAFPSNLHEKLDQQNASKGPGVYILDSWLASGGPRHRLGDRQLLGVHIIFRISELFVPNVLISRMDLSPTLSPRSFVFTLFTAERHPHSLKLCLFLSAT